MSAYMPPPASLRPGAIVWDYLRDSGGTAQELSVQQQAQEVENFCTQYGFVHVRTNRDVARSGTSTTGRDAFLEMVDQIRNPQNRPNAILIWNFARFARDVSDAQYYKSLIRKYGVIVHSLTDPVPDSEYSLIIETLIDFSNQEKSRQTSRDVKRALHTLANQGYSVGGTPPRCYLAEKVQIGEMRDGTPRVVSRWIPDPDLWELGQLAWKLRAEGKSYGYIQDATGGRIYQSKASWNSFFANESYLGIGKCGDEKIPNHHPAMIDQETWNKVQKRRRAHPKNGTGEKGNHPRSIAAPSLLVGLMFCEHCGAAMSHQTYKASAWRCYVCGTKNRTEWKACPTQMVNARNAEIVVLHTVLTRILTPEYFIELLAQVQERFSDNGKTIKQAKELQAALSKVERSISNLLDALENQGVASAAARLKEREAEKATLLAKLQVLENQQAATSLNVSQEAIALAMDNWKQQLIQDLQAQDILAARAILQQFVSRIEVSYDHIRIFYRYTLDKDLMGTRDLSLDGNFIDQDISGLSSDCIQSVFEIAPHLAPATRKPRQKKGISQRDQEIYRLHTEEKRTVPSLAAEFGLSEKSIWGICARVRKQIADSQA